MRYSEIESLPPTLYEILSVERMLGTKNPVIIIKIEEDEKFDLNICREDFALDLQRAFENVLKQELYQDKTKGGKITLVDDLGERCFMISSTSPNLISIAAGENILFEDFLEAYTRKLEKEIKLKPQG